MDIDDLIPNMTYSKKNVPLRRGFSSIWPQNPTTAKKAQNKEMPLKKSEVPYFLVIQKCMKLYHFL